MDDILEGTFTRKLLRALRRHAALKDAVIWKLNDRTTGGIPDILVSTHEGHTTFWEVKIAPNSCTKLQKYYLEKLRFSWVVRASTDGRWVAIFDANRVVNAMRDMPFASAVEEIVRRCTYA